MTGETEAGSPRAWFVPPRLSLSSDLWMIWLEIAIEHGRATNEARVRVEDAPPTSALAEALKEELKAALLTMTTWPSLHGVGRSVSSWCWPSSGERQQHGANVAAS